MEQLGWYFWVGAAVVALVLVLVFRRTGFRASAEAFGAKVELEGKGGEKPAVGPPPAPAAAAGGAVEAKGGGIAVGGDARGTFVAGERNRVGRG